MAATIDLRGVIRFELAGIPLAMSPSFANLSMMEKATGKGCVFLFQQSRIGNISVSDIAIAISMIAKPDGEGVKLPKGWNPNIVGQHIMDEGFDKFVGYFCDWLNASMSVTPSKVAPASPEDGQEAGE